MGARLAVIAAIAAGVSSLTVAHGLGYDAWSWMVWARELLHGTFSTAGGPSLKPLPVLLVAPATPLGDLAPLAWLGLQRVCALVALLLAWRVAARLAGPAAGWIAMLMLALSPDLAATALYGSSEPLLLVLVLAAADRGLAGRDRLAFVLLALSGLIRPELWLVVAGLATLRWWSQRRVDVVIAAMVLAAPLIWIAMTWLGSGSPFSQLRGAPGGHYDGAVAALAGAVAAITLPALVLGLGAAADAMRRRRPDVVLLAAAGAAWVLIVAAMTQAGYPGTRRYFVGPAALFAVLGGVGAARLAERLPRARARLAAPVVALVVLVVLVLAGPTIVRTARTIGVAREQDTDLVQLKSAIALAGGARSVVAVGRPVVNPWRQSALAWQLDVPLAATQPAWHSTLSSPHWRPPAIVFSGPTRRAGPRPATRRDVRTQPIGRVGAWRIERALARRRRSALTRETRAGHSRATGSPRVFSGK